MSNGKTRMQWLTILVPIMMLMMMAMVTQDLDGVGDNVLVGGDYDEDDAWLYRPSKTERRRCR